MWDFLILEGIGDRSWSQEKHGNLLVCELYTIVNDQTIGWMIKQTIRSESMVVIYKVSDWVSVMARLWMWQAINSLISDCWRCGSCCACLLSARRAGQKPHLHQSVFKGLEGQSGSFEALGKPVRGASLSVASLLNHIKWLLNHINAHWYLSTVMKALSGQLVKLSNEAD